MPIAAETVAEMIRAGLSGADVVVRGAQDHFEAKVIWPGFAGKSLIERHRAVYASLGDAMHKDIHALALKTLTPEEKA